MTYKFGDYVVYNTTGEIGRVFRKSSIAKDTYYVCWHCGCATTSTTPASLMRPATPEEIASAPAGIGYHRFDEVCPHWEAEECLGCNAGPEEEEE